MKDYGRFFGKIVSHTTRAPRPSEENGVHYHFIDQITFQELVANGSFIEWAVVHGNYYGTSISALKDVQAAGKICIFEIDIQGAKTIKEHSLQLGMYPKFAFISPPSLEMLRERLDMRYDLYDYDTVTRLTTPTEVRKLKSKNSFESKTQWQR
jgi:guanylate kinase